MIGKRIKQGVMTVASGVLLSACANHNALLQSPIAKSTDAIDQINADLDTVLVSDAVVPGAPAESNGSPAAIPASVMAALQPELTAPLGASQSVSKRFDIAVNGLSAQHFFSSLVDGTHYNMVVHPDVAGDISLTLKDVTIPEVLAITKDIYGYEYEENGRLIKVYPAGLHTRIFEINYLNVKRQGDSETRVSSGQITFSGGSDTGSNDSNGSNNKTSGTGTQINTRSESFFWENLTDTLKLIVGSETGRSVVITPSAGVVVVRADADEIAAVSRYLESAELIMQRQVILEAKILEVELSEGYQQGIDWAFADAESIRPDGTARRSVDLIQSARNIISSDIGGVFTSAITHHNFTTTIQLLGTQGNVQVLSSPRISTVNNQKAVIKVGSDEYYVTDIEFESDTDSDTSSTDIDLTPFFSGIALDVTPQISEEGKIILHVHPTISKVEDQNKVINVGGRELDLPLALSTIRETDSVITAENGQIVVIGGLIQNTSSDNDGSVPFFGDLPLIGELFKQKDHRSSKTELVILLRPTITDANVYAQDIRSSRDRFGRFRESMKQAPETRFY